MVQQPNLTSVCAERKRKVVDKLLRKGKSFEIRFLFRFLFFAVWTSELELNNIFSDLIFIRRDSWQWIKICCKVLRVRGRERGEKRNWIFFLYAFVSPSEDFFFTDSSRLSHHYSDYQENKCTRKYLSHCASFDIRYTCTIHALSLSPQHRRVMKKLHNNRQREVRQARKKKNTWSTLKRCFTTYGMWKC